MLQIIFRNDSKTHTQRHTLPAQSHTYIFEWRTAQNRSQLFHQQQFVIRTHTLGLQLILNNSDIVDGVTSDSWRSALTSLIRKRNRWWKINNFVCSWKSVRVESRLARNQLSPIKHFASIRLSLTRNWPACGPTEDSCSDARALSKTYYNRHCLRALTFWIIFGKGQDDFRPFVSIF